MGIFTRLLESLTAWLGKSEARPAKRKRRESVQRKSAKKKKVKRSGTVLSGTHLNKRKARCVPSRTVPFKTKEPKEIAVVTHYFPKAGAAAMRILSGEIKMGDKLLFQGKTDHFTQQVKSLQINRIPIDTGRPGEEVGLKVKKTVQEGDKVYRL